MSIFFNGLFISLALASMIVKYIYIYIYVFGHVTELSIECQAAYVPERGSSQHVVQKGIFFFFFLRM